jgi:hypothetical protein
MLSLRHRHPRRTTFRRSAIWCKTFHMARALSFNLFEHWNGLAWTLTLINTNAFEALTGVSADAIDDAWAVGWVSPLTTGSNEPLAIHWNGTNWVSAVTPHVGQGANESNAVLALTPNDV